MATISGWLNSRDSVWFRAFVSVALLAWLASRIDLGEAVRSIAAISPAHLGAAMALMTVDRALMIVRWVMLVRRSESTVSVRSAVWMFMVGAYLGSLLPSGGGDAVRAYALARRTERGVEAIALVVIDRYVGICSLALLAAAGLFVWGDQVALDLRRLSAVAAVTVMLGAVGLLWSDRILAIAVPARWTDGVGTARLLRLGHAIGQHRNRIALVAALLALSLTVQLIRVVQAYVFGRGLGIDVAFTYYLAFMPVGMLAMQLPVSIAGLGVAQGVFIWLLRPVGVPAAQSFALSTLLVLTGLLSTVPGAVMHFRSRKAWVPRRDRFPD